MSIVLEGKYVTVSDAAKELGRTVQRVRQLIKSGQLPAEPWHGRLLAIPRKALDEFKKIERPAGYHIDKRPDQPTKRRRKGQ